MVFVALIVAFLFIVVAWPIVNLDRKMIKMYPSGWIERFPGKSNPNAGQYIPAIGEPEPAN